MSQTVESALAVLLLVVAGVAPAGAVAGAAPADGGAAAMQSSCSFPVTATDATGTEVTVEQTPERVVTLGPSAAQTMWEIGGKSQVVGVSQYASYLAGADSRANVSGAGRTFVNVEKVVAQDPGFVLAPNVIPNATVEKLRNAGLTVFKFEEAESVEDIYAKTTLIGDLTGNCEGAADTVSEMRDRISTVREAVEGAESPRVLVSQGGGWTAGNGTFIGNMVELAGGTNVAAEANISGYGKISEEVVVQRDPQWIVQIGQYGAYPKTAAYNGTTAVKQGQIISVTNENVSQPAPRVVNAIVKMAKAFHPDAYAAANATATANGTTVNGTTAANGTTADATTTVSETQATQTTGASEAATSAETTTSTATTTAEGALQEETETTTADESGGSVPGFGVPAALAALAGAALLARRR